MCFFKRNRSCFTEGGSAYLHPVKRTRRLLLVCRQSCTESGILITFTDNGFFPSTEYHKWVRRTSVSFSFFDRHTGPMGIFIVLCSRCQGFPLRPYKQILEEIKEPSDNIIFLDFEDTAALNAISDQTALLSYIDNHL